MEPKKLSEYTEEIVGDMKNVPLEWAREEAIPFAQQLSKRLSEVGYTDVASATAFLPVINGYVIDHIYDHVGTKTEPLDTSDLVNWLGSEEGQERLRLSKQMEETGLHFLTYMDAKFPAWYKGDDEQEIRVFSDWNVVDEYLKSGPSEEFDRKVTLLDYDFDYVCDTQRRINDLDERLPEDKRIYPAFCEVTDKMLKEGETRADVRNFHKYLDRVNENIDVLEKRIYQTPKEESRVVPSGGLEEKLRTKVVQMQNAGKHFQVNRSTGKIVVPKGAEKYMSTAEIDTVVNHLRDTVKDSDGNRTRRPEVGRDCEL